MDRYGDGEGESALALVGVLSMLAVNIDMCSCTVLFAIAL